MRWLARKPESHLLPGKRALNYVWCAVMKDGIGEISMLDGSQEELGNS